MFKKNSYKHKVIFYIVLYSSFITFSCTTESISNQSNQGDDKIIARYNGGVVRSIDVKIQMDKIISKNEKLKNLQFESLNSDLQQALIQEVVINDLSCKKAKGLDNHQDYQMALKLFESELLKQKIYIEIASEIKQEKNLQKKYDQLVKKLQSKKDYRLSYIEVKTQKEADEIYSDLNKNPQKFSEIAKKKSLEKESGKKGGDLGFVLEDAFPIEVVNAIKKLKKDQIAQPILSANRFLIVKFIDDRKAEILPFSKAKEVLTQSLIKKALEDFNRAILKEAELKIEN